MDHKDVPFIVHEGMMSRMERQMKRLFILLAILIAALVISNAAWLYAWVQYDYSCDTVTVDGTDGVANYIGNDGEIVNGESGSKKAQAYPQGR